MIYFLQSVEGGPIKIGHSDNVVRRHSQLEFQYGKPLAILAMLPGDREEEAEIHARFSHLRMGLTEQFRPAPELLAFIGRPLLASANPDAVEVMPSRMKPMIAQLRGSEEFKAWFEELARFDGLTPTALFDRAVRRYAKEVGFTKESPMR